MDGRKKADYIVINCLIEYKIVGVNMDKYRLVLDLSGRRLIDNWVGNFLL